MSSKKGKKVRQASPETEMLSSLSQANKTKIASSSEKEHPEPVAGASTELTEAQKKVIQDFIDQSPLLSAIQDFTMDHPLGLLPLPRLMSEFVGITESDGLTNISADQKALWREAQIAMKRVLKPYLSRNLKTYSVQNLAEWIITDGTCSTIFTEIRFPAAFGKMIGESYPRVQGTRRRRGRSSSSSTGSTSTSSTCADMSHHGVHARSQKKRRNASDEELEDILFEAVGSQKATSAISQTIYKRGKDGCFKLFSPGEKGEYLVKLDFYKTRNLRRVAKENWWREADYRTTFVLSYADPAANQIKKILKEQVKKIAQIPDRKEKKRKENIQCNLPRNVPKVHKFNVEDKRTDAPREKEEGQPPFWSSLDEFPTQKSGE